MRYNKAKGRKITIDVTGLLQMKIAICDDDQILCHHLEEMLLELGRKEQTILQTELFFDGDTLWNYLKQGYPF